MRALLVLVLAAAGCAAGPSVTTDDDDVKIDTSSADARRQYDVNVAFATGYRSRCLPLLQGSTRPRVLLTGFGRFLQVTDNATGRLVSHLVPSARYPQTAAPAPGQLDLPEPQLSIGATTMNVPGFGDVDVCAMILPVHWDMASVLIAKEADALRPHFVMMNGVAGPRQPIYLELGATNRASKLPDGTNQLRPVTLPGETLATLVDGGDLAQPNLVSWSAVQAAAKDAVARHEAEREAGTRFGEIVQGVKLAGFPRASNTYLCNNVTYVTGWLMNHPGQSTPLLQAGVPRTDAPNAIATSVSSDLRGVPRVFVHWPSDLANRHHAAAADVMRSILFAQLAALGRGENPTFGDPRDADPALAGGTFF